MEDPLAAAIALLGDMAAPAGTCPMCGLKGHGKPDQYGRVWCSHCRYLKGLPVAMTGFCNIGRHRRRTALVGPGGEFRCGKHLHLPATGTGDKAILPGKGQAVCGHGEPFEGGLLCEACHFASTGLPSDPGDEAIDPADVAELRRDVVAAAASLTPYAQTQFYRSIAARAVKGEALDLVLACDLSWFSTGRSREPWPPPGFHLRTIAARLLKPVPTCAECGSTSCRLRDAGYLCEEHHAR